MKVSPRKPCVSNKSSADVGFSRGRKAMANQKASLHGHSSRRRKSSRRKSSIRRKASLRNNGPFFYPPDYPLFPEGYGFDPPLFEPWPGYRPQNGRKAKLKKSRIASEMGRMPDPLSFDDMVALYKRIGGVDGIMTGMSKFHRMAKMVEDIRPLMRSLFGGLPR